MKNISFRVRDEDYARLVEILDCKPTQYFSQRVRLLVGSENTTNTGVDSDTLKTTRPVKSFVTQAQYEELTEAAKQNGWPLSKEIRHRLAIATPDRIIAHTELLHLLQRLDDLAMQTWMDNLLRVSNSLKWGYTFRSENTERTDEIDELKAEFKRLRREVSDFKRQLKDLKVISERV
ncbi:hypothetical protein [Erwinia sp. JH02]|uniref:hypothetical protein n=1 Tax=Erwinia sp. JH02 TaxID=2733394 RepID=UPI001489976C|nr:hypothetical protein [Erwinia sp. JH02]NNS10128.1 hypothetical protein [Erwinia sp. JH02]